MAQKNDERIMQLKQQIEIKRKELANQTSRFTPITNCLLVLNNITYNLHVESSELLLIRVNMMAMSAKDLGLDISKVMISGYSIENWLDDIRNYLKIQKYKEEKRKLEKLEKQLDALLSDDKRTELEIDNIAALLG
jgi:hypothetical protein